MKSSGDDFDDIVLSKRLTSAIVTVSKDFNGLHGCIGILDEPSDDITASLRAISSAMFSSFVEKNFENESANF